MPDEKKFDPFKPQQPSIPGVLPRTETAKAEPSPEPEVSSSPAERQPQPQIKLIAIASAAVVFMLIVLIYWGRSTSHKSVPVSADTTASPQSLPEVAPRPQPSEPMGPGVIATSGELAKPWASKRFQYRNFVSGQLQPAIVVRLPRGDYWGFSLIEPFGNCQLEFVTDLDKLKA